MIKNLPYFVVILLVYNVTIAQTRLQITYDDSGNQVLRELRQMPPAKQLRDHDALQDYPEDTPPQALATIPDILDPEDPEAPYIITYYPNPVKDELFVQWPEDPYRVVSRLDLYSPSGQHLRSFANPSGQYHQTVSFFYVPPGVYPLVLSYTNGQIKTIKIIKN